MLFSRYNLKGIRVSLEVNLLSSFYLFRFCFILHLSFTILTLRRVMHWDLSVMTQIMSTVLRILSFFFFTVGHFREFTNITYQWFYWLTQKYLISDGYFHPCKSNWGSYIISIAKTASKNIWSLNSFYQVGFSWGCFISL